MLFLLLAASEGHVRLNYIDGSDMPIRNAGTATGNGRASVLGGLVCGQNTNCGRRGPKLSSLPSYGTGQARDNLLIGRGSSCPPPNSRRANWQAPAISMFNTYLTLQVLAVGRTSGAPMAMRWGRTGCRLL